MDKFPKGPQSTEELAELLEANAARVELAVLDGERELNSGEPFVTLDDVAPPTE